jgi:carboxypeptidase C (cathepsin A)
MRELFLMLLYVAVQRTANEVPIVDPPERIAGFFKLNRTKDAHMFYFYYESRSKGPNDPVILWMTGQQSCAASLAGTKPMLHVLVSACLAN